MHFLAGSVSMIEQTRTEVKKRFSAGQVSHGVVSPDSRLPDSKKVSQEKRPLTHPLRLT